MFNTVCIHVKFMSINHLMSAKSFGAQRQIIKWSPLNYNIAFHYTCNNVVVFASAELHMYFRVYWCGSFSGYNTLLYIYCGIDLFWDLMHVHVRGSHLNNNKITAKCNCDQIWQNHLNQAYTHIQLLNFNQLYLTSKYVFTQCSYSIA